LLPAYDVSEVSEEKEKEEKARATTDGSKSVMSP